MTHRETDEQTLIEISKQVFIALGHRYTYGCTIPLYAADGNGMLLLIEEARMKDIQLWFVPKSRFVQCTAYDAKQKRYFYAEIEYGYEPKGIALVFLKASGADITPYLEGVGK